MPPKAPIVIGEFYMARVLMTFPQRKTVDAHVRVLRELEPDLWEVENTLRPAEHHSVGSAALTPESDQMRESRLKSWATWGQPK